REDNTRPDKAFTLPSGNTFARWRFAYQAYEAHTFVGRIRRSCHPTKLCLMRFAYQAYGAHTFVGRIRRSRHPAKICLMRFAYQAYEADTFVGWVRHPITC
ncbi:hypothetical protein OGX83_02530, partial [Citrobacter sp. Cpo074]|uniref:hypothetical protein n=1 Tax=Citrobacter sp. Cpo074 TaxID=2985135 RepID=UPI0025757072